MYPSSGATIRGDINAKVEEAAAASKFFIGTRVMPPVGVTVKSGVYPKIQIAGGELLTAVSTVRSRSGSYGEISRNWTTDTYDCIDRGLEEPIDDVDQRDLARFFNLEVVKARLILQNMQLDHELRVASAILNTTTFSPTNSVVAYTEANLATISIVRDIQDAIERVNGMGQEANTIVMSSQVYNRIRRAPLLQSWISGSVNPGAKVTADTIAQSFADQGIEQVLIGRSRYNNAAKSKAYSETRVWPNSHIWVGAVNRGARMIEDALTGGCGFTLYWNAEGGLFVSETYRDEKRRSNVVRVRQNTIEKVTDATAGTLIATQYS